jgi:hypothetical protein
MTDWARRVYAQPYYAEGKTHAVARTYYGGAVTTRCGRLLPAHTNSKRPNHLVFERGVDGPSAEHAPCTRCAETMKCEGCSDRAEGFRTVPGIGARWHLTCGTH